MDNQTLLYIMTAFVVIAGLSLLLQLVLIFGLYRATKTLQAKAMELLPKVESLVDVSHKAVVEGKQQILDVTAKTNEILDSTRRQLTKVEEVVSDASARAKVQLERAELVLDDTMTRAHEAVSTVHGGIMRPLREIHGVTAGIKAVLGHLATGRRSNVVRIAHDEEMFI